MLRVPVDPMVMAGDASMLGGLIFRSTDLTLRGLTASQLTKRQYTSRTGNEVVCLGDGVGAGA